MLHAETPVTCKYNNTAYTGKDVSDLLDQLRRAALAAKNTSTGFGFGSFGGFGAKPAAPAATQPADEAKAKAEKLLQAVNSQMKVRVATRTERQIERLLMAANDRAKKYMVTRLVELGQSPYLLNYAWKPANETVRMTDAKVLEGRRFNDRSLCLYFCGIWTKSWRRAV